MMPCADMSVGAVADVPMCEFWLFGFNTSYSVIEVPLSHTLRGACWWQRRPLLPMTPSGGRRIQRR